MHVNHRTLLKRGFISVGLLLAIVITLLTLGSNYKAKADPWMTSFKDSNNIKVELFSDADYSVPLTQNASLSAYTTYYVQVTHPTMASVDGGTNSLTLRNMTQGSVNFGDGTSTKTFTQSGSGPYIYRSSFVTPAAANTYALEIQLQNSGNTQRAIARGWKLIVGATSNYVRTYSDSAMTIETDTFAPGDTVYVKTYNGSSGYSNHTPNTGDSSVIFNSFGQSSNTTVSMLSTSQTNRTYTCSFRIPTTASGDKWVRTTIMSDAPYPRPEFLLHIATPDRTAPSIDSIVPAGYYTSTSAAIAAYYSDADSGIDTSSVVVALDGTALDCGATDAQYGAVTADYATCVESGLTQGAHMIDVTVADMAANYAYGSQAFFVDTRTPSVMNGYQPANNAIVNTASPTISFTAYDRLASGETDPATVSGLDFSTIAVTLDSNPLACAISPNASDAQYADVSCPTSGLADGSHSWNYYFKDNAGNEATRTRSFTVSTCIPAKPDLSVSIQNAFWANYTDYLNGELSVNLTIANSGTDDASNVMINGSSNTNGVMMVNTPYSIGTIAAASSAPVTVKYSVPMGVVSFKTTLSASAEDLCGNTYYYGGGMPT